MKKESGKDKAAVLVLVAGILIFLIPLFAVLGRSVSNNGGGTSEEIPAEVEVEKIKLSNGHITF